MVSGANFEMPGGVSEEQNLCHLVCGSKVAASWMPISRWPDSAARDDVGNEAAAYGAFVRNFVEFDVSGFGISLLESRVMDPQMALILQVGHAALIAS